MKILVTGGCGYTGSILVKTLISKNHKVVVLDNLWFGNFLPKHKNLKIIKKDIRDIKNIKFDNFEAVIHLANIANDPSVDLSPELSWNVNVLATKELIEKSIICGAKKFIFASSGSVYGVKKEKNVTENLTLVPISTYNKTKMIAEKVLESYSKEINVFSVRPATVCGVSPRMRLDLTVNMFCYQAYKNKLITVFGGKQIRPNIHINDLVNVYSHFLFKKNIRPGCYNAGFENYSIKKIAEKIARKFNAKIVIKKIKDIRSYRQNSDKLIKTGFQRLYSIDRAIDELHKYFVKEKFKDHDSFYTVKWMKKLNIK